MHVDPRDRAPIDAMEVQGHIQAGQLTSCRTQHGQQGWMWYVHAHCVTELATRAVWSVAHVQQTQLVPVDALWTGRSPQYQWHQAVAVPRMGISPDGW